MKILFHYDAGPKLKEKVKQLCRSDIEIVCCSEDDKETFLKEIVDADVIWHVLHPLTENILKQARQLKLIQKIGVGTNTIDLNYARANNIAVCNMPGTNSQATAEMALLLIMAAARRLPLMEKACRSGQWRIKKQVEEQLGEIKGKTVGLIGFGSVASILADMLQAIGANVIYTATAKKDASYPFVGLAELFVKSDIVSLHAALTPQTEKMIDESALAQMKDGAILVNTARGALIDELAVYAALLTGKLGAAAFDVFTVEPIDINHNFLKLDNVVLAPHLGWLTEETLDRSIEVAFGNSLSVKNRRLDDLQFRVV